MVLNLVKHTFKKILRIPNLCLFFFSSFSGCWVFSIFYFIFHFKRYMGTVLLPGGRNWQLIPLISTVFAKAFNSCSKDSKSYFLSSICGCWVFSIFSHKINASKDIWEPSCYLVAETGSWFPLISTVFAKACLFNFSQPWKKFANTGRRLQGWVSTGSIFTTPNIFA